MIEKPNPDSKNKAIRRIVKEVIYDIHPKMEGDVAWRLTSKILDFLEEENIMVPIGTIFLPGHWPDSPNPTALEGK